MLNVRTNGNNSVIFQKYQKVVNNLNSFCEL